MYIFVRHFVFENAPAQAQKAHAPLRHGARAQKRTNPDILSLGHLSHPGIQTFFTPIQTDLNQIINNPIKH